MKQISMTESTMTEAMAQIDALEGLTPKEKGSLRLLTEEMFSVCRELLNEGTLDFEVKCDGRRYALRVSAKTWVNEDVRREFLSMSSSGENAANKGIRGLLGAVLEAFACNEASPCGSAWTYGMSMPGAEYASMWTLSHYMEYAPQDKIESDWDGMEKSIIASFSDDVAIGVRSGRLEMTVTKTF